MAQGDKDGSNGGHEHTWTNIYEGGEKVGEICTGCGAKRS